MKINVTPIKAFSDNYIWAIQVENSTHVVLVDPGQAEPCIEFIEKNNLQLSAILITHHHWDHTSGIEALKNYAAKQGNDITVYGPTSEDIKHCDVKLAEGDNVVIEFNALNSEALTLIFSILDLPGHTLGHIAYITEDALFCGDTLFSGGCGRLFEGTPEQMHQSLTKLASLPELTPVYCTHEYTLANLHFARTVEPTNQQLEQYFKEVTSKRSQNEITLPSTIKQELSINPFLRCEQPDVVKSVEQRCQQKLPSAVDVFTELRQWKDNY